MFNLVCGFLIFDLILLQFSVPSSSLLQVTENEEKRNERQPKGYI